MVRNNEGTEGRNSFLRVNRRERENWSMSEGKESIRFGCVVSVRGED